MAKLKLSAVPDDRPVKLNLELPATVHRDLVAYAELLGRETGQVVEPIRLIAPMLDRFMSTDRGFVKARRPAQIRAGGVAVQTQITPGSSFEPVEGG